MDRGHKRETVNRLYTISLQMTNITADNLVICIGLFCKYFVDNSYKHVLYIFSNINLNNDINTFHSTDSISSCTGTRSIGKNVFHSYHYFNVLILS